ncbi:MULTISPECIES: ATP-binding cassette domain-containing protein [Streptomyces]|uniref:hypothetical protein n=1 Tax=Streptomyces TaxID=1883 RepID=UPI0031CDCE77
MAGELGYLPGELRLYPELTGAQTLDLLCSLQGRPCGRRAELCERLGLTPAVLRRTVGGYSRGMKQKLGWRVTGGLQYRAVPEKHVGLAVQQVSRLLVVERLQPF